MYCSQIDGLSTESTRDLYYTLYYQSLYRDAVKILPAILTSLTKILKAMTTESNEHIHENEKSLSVHILGHNS